MRDARNPSNQPRLPGVNLYFLRHAKACARSRKWRPDSTRPLTRDGEKKMFEAALGIQKLDLSLDLILTSPHIRAFRTAEILGEVFGARKVVETKSLIPEAEPKAIISEINENFAALKQIVLVGHEPFLSRLISILLSGKDTVPIELRKGGFCKLSITELGFGPCGCMEWLLTASQLARMGKGK
jgi:phosphohistidine phosphatase